MAQRAASLLKAANTLSTPAARGGGWGFDLTNPWLVSLEHVSGTGSLNNFQAQASGEGTITCVISLKDTSIRNWLSISGFHAGNILMRWQVLPESSTTADGTIRSAKVVKLTDLTASLPTDPQRVTEPERQRLIEQRAIAYSNRYTTTPAVARLVAPRWTTQVRFPEGRPGRTGVLRTSNFSGEPTKLISFLGTSPRRCQGYSVADPGRDSQRRSSNRDIAKGSKDQYVRSGPLGGIVCQPH